jgi:hypothetical protein
MQSIKYLPASSGVGNPSLMTVQTLRAANATTIITNTVSGVPAFFYATMGTPHTFTDPVTGETITIISEATAVDFAGHTNSGQLVIDAIAPGYTDAGSKVGDIVVLRPLTEWSNNLFNILNAGAHNDDGTLAKTALDTFYKPPELIANFVASGGVWTLVSGLNGTMTLSVFYMNGLRYSLAAIASRAYTASKDTYVDFLVVGATPSVVYTEVTNGAVAPALAANSIRIAKVITSGAAITAITQYGKTNTVQTYPTSIIPNQFFEELGRNTLTANGTSLDVTFTPRKYLKIYALVVPTGVVGMAIQFNGDTAGNYSLRLSDNGGADGTFTSQTSITLAPGTINSLHFAEIEIVNFQTDEKVIVSHLTANGTAGAANITSRREQQGKWANNTALINRIVISGATYGAGSELIVLGHD